MILPIMSYAQIIHLQNIISKKLCQQVYSLRKSVVHHWLNEQLLPFAMWAEFLQREEALNQTNIEVQDWLNIGTAEWVRNFEEKVALLWMIENFAALTLDESHRS